MYLLFKLTALFIHANFSNNVSIVLIIYTVYPVALSYYFKLTIVTMYPIL